MQSFTVRPSIPALRAARTALIQRTWRQAYAHLFPASLMDDLFGGRVEQVSAWSDARRELLTGRSAFDSAETLIGMVGLALLDTGGGEVVALYVEPAWHGRGVGRALWQAGAAVLREHGAAWVDVWTLARADAVGFYEKLGCVRFADDVYRIGDHHEPAVGLRMPL
ncbi:MAG: GNAT family N-acetyltransferase [bacterium]|nr:GNAT family N-acetyltransferase [bacterium]